jgi:ferrous iron transport protein B
LSQVADLGARYVVALNMYDLAQRRGLRIDHAELSTRLGVPVVPMVAHRGEGLVQLRRAIRRAAETTPHLLRVNWPSSVGELVESTAARSNGGRRPPLSAGQVRRLLFDERPPESRWLLREAGDIPWLSAEAGRRLHCGRC